MRMLLGWGRRCGGGGKTRQSNRITHRDRGFARGRVDEVKQSLSNIDCTATTIFQAAIESAVSNSPTRDRRRSDARSRAKPLNCADDVILCHRRIRDYCPLHVKGLLSPIYAGPIGRTKAP